MLLISFIKKMKWPKNIILAYCIAGSLVGCRKECSQLPGCTHITALLHSSGNWYHFLYNSDGKPRRESNGSIITTYAYNGNTTTVTTLDSGGFVSRTVITLNELKLATNMRQENNEAGTHWNNTVYEYNGEAVVKSTTTFSNGGIPMVSIYTWANQNLSSIIAGNTSNTFSYYTDKQMQPGDYLSLLQLRQGYEIYRNKNLLRSISGTNFSYTFGPADKITSVDATLGAGTKNFDYQIMYDCN